jgi:hypothetical protein
LRSNSLADLPSLTRRRSALIPLNLPVEISQARGLAGTRSGPLFYGREEGVLQRLLRGIEVAEKADHVANTPRDWAR